MKTLIQKLNGFENSLQINKELKASHNLCKKIEDLNPGLEALIVGGAVRDLVMGKQPYDIDIATNVDTNILTDQFKSYNIGQSKSFGLVVIPFGGFQFEIAHYREDVGSSDHRRPDTVKFVKSFEKDSARRDFTINSLGLNTNGEIVDHQNGLNAIKNQIISTVGSPQGRFTEDYLRILRGLRFSAVLGYEIEDHTKQAMKELVKYIPEISTERIKEELTKVASVSGKALANYIQLLDEIDALQMLLPEVKNLQKYEHSKIYHPEGNVWQHTLKALEAITSSNPLVNLSILFHDIGKATTFVRDENGNITYRGHEKEGAILFGNLANRLRFSNLEIEAIKFAVANHMRAHRINEMSKNKVLQLRQSPHWELLKQVLIADTLVRGVSSMELNKLLDDVDKMIKIFGEKQEFNKKISVLINGNMVINKAKEIGYEFTRENSHYIGEIKKNIIDLIVKNDFNITPEVIQKQLKESISALMAM